ncbi:MAG: hypothetical protein EBU85_01145 [Actinobacteria bacterium]|nr:hypothetical protein [Actinomycetota bacterium]
MADSDIARAHAAQQSSSTAVTTTSGAKVIGVILLIGGILLAVSPFIWGLLDCAMNDNYPGCGAGAIALIFTVPTGGLLAAIGAILIAVGASRAKKQRATAYSAPVSTAEGTPFTSPSEGTPLSSPSEGTPLSSPSGVTHRPARAIPSVRAGQIFIGVALTLFMLGVIITPQRGEGARGFVAAVSPIDCWWLAALCGVVGTFILLAHRDSYSPEQFWGRTQLWCGVVVLSWSFLLFLLMGVGAGIGEYVNQAFDSGDREASSPLGLLTGSSMGPSMSIFPAVIVGMLLMLRGIRRLR